MDKRSSLFLELTINFVLLFVRKMMAKDSCIICLTLFYTLCSEDQLNILGYLTWQPKLSLNQISLYVKAFIDSLNHDDHLRDL